MQRYLYLDSCEGVVCGLLERGEDREWNWLELKEFRDQKGSALLHGLLYEILNEHEMDLSHLDGILLASGPGSYTGMRLAEGMAQVLEWQNFSIYSFYHFEVPRICGVERGVWIANAFKKEAFVFQWDKKTEEKRLVREDSLSLESEQKNGKVFFLRESILERSSLQTQSSFELIKNRPTKIFEFLVRNNIRKAPYYYRPLESEYKVKSDLK